MLVRFEVDFCNGEGEEINYDFQVDLHSEFEAVEYAIDWINVYLHKHPKYEFWYCRVTDENTSIIYPTIAQKNVLMCIEGNV